MYQPIHLREMTDEQHETLKEIVLSELDACGYFIADYDSKLMKQNNTDWKPYSSKSFGEMLMDFACLYNIEYEGINYKFEKLEQ